MPELLRYKAYRQIDAFTHVVTMQGECGTELLRVTRVSRVSADHAQQLCEQAWCEWTADKIVPGRRGIQKRVAAPEPATVETPPPAAPSRTRSHARVHLGNEKSRVLA